MNHIKRLILVLSLSLSIFGAASAEATLISTPLTSDSYITYNGLDWAWASPVASTEWGSNTLMAPGYHEGWRYATIEEWATRPDPSLFLTDPNNVSSAKIATAYWNTLFTHIDYSDAVNGYVTSMLTGDWSETWYVRDNSAAVPEPSTMLLLGGGLAGLAFWRKKKQS